jgi:hypothetical protein
MYSSKARHAFLILVHEKPKQVARLIDALQHPSFDVYLHVDTGAEADFYDLRGLQFMGSKYNVSWGGVR